MALIVPPGFGSAAIVLEAGVGTTPFITTIGVDLSSAGGDFVSAANTVYACYANAFLTSTSPDLTLTKVILSVGQDGGDTPTVESNLPAQAGTGSGEYLPLSNALLLNKSTALLGRKGRGRMFVPGVMKDSQVDISGRIGQTTVDAFNTVAEDFLASLVDDVFEIPTPAVLLHGPAVGGAPAPTPILGLTVGPIVGTLPRRIK